MRRSRRAVCSCWVVTAGGGTRCGGRGTFSTVGTGDVVGTRGELTSSKSICGGAGVLGRFDCGMVWTVR